MYVIYHISSTMQVGPTENGNPHSLYAKVYKTRHNALVTMRKWNDRALEQDAQHAKRVAFVVGDNRHVNLGEGRTGGVGPGPYGVAHVDHYRTHVVRKVTRTNLLSGQEFTEDSNTPGFCSPSSEAYWSM
jgi:uncharacterized protein (UPF0254 family)